MEEITDIRTLNERISEESEIVTLLTRGMEETIIGQKHLTESLLIGLLADGHVLLEGVPGLAKTLAIKTLSSLIEAKFSRIQFTPDLLPADVTGTLIYSPRDENFKVKNGPIFANFVLADEINRSDTEVIFLDEKREEKLEELKKSRESAIKIRDSFNRYNLSELYNKSRNYYSKKNQVKNLNIDLKKGEYALYLIINDIYFKTNVKVVY